MLGSVILTPTFPLLLPLCCFTTRIFPCERATLSLPFHFHLQHTNILFNFYVFLTVCPQIDVLWVLPLCCWGPNPEHCVYLWGLHHWELSFQSWILLESSRPQQQASAQYSLNVWLYLWPGQRLSLGHLFPRVPLSSPTQASLVTSSCSMAKGPWPWLEAVSELSCLTGVLPPSLFLLRMSVWASCPMGNSFCAADLQKSATFLARTSAPVWQSYHSNYDALKGWRRDFVSVAQSLAHLPLVRWWLLSEVRYLHVLVLTPWTPSSNLHMSR